MPAPDAQEHLAYRYLEAGLSIIPVERGLKVPSPMLPRRAWKQYQTRAPTLDEVNGWLAQDPDTNWGLICGQGAVCADADDIPLSEWLLANPTHPALRGATLHRSGRNKAHVLFQTTGPCPTTVWRMLPGRNAGELKGDGGYVLVPPSKLDGHGEYRRVVGSMRALPTIDDVQGFLGAITDAFLRDNPDQVGPPLDHSNRNILVLDAEQTTQCTLRIRALGLKKKILDTLLQPGNQDPGTRHWTQLVDPSHSAIDYAVVCELVRKGWAFVEIEETFAATLVGDACYKNTQRPNHGQGYLLRTYDNARKQVEAEQAAARSAQGANFIVAEATRSQNETDSFYHLLIRTTQGPAKQGWITLSHTELLAQREFVRVCFGPPLHFVAQFLAAQNGQGFLQFTAAVEGMVSEEMPMPQGSSRLGHLVFLARVALSRLPSRVDDPLSQSDSPMLGWQRDGTYLLRLGRLYIALKASEHNLKNQEVHEVLGRLGPWRVENWRWPDGSVEELIRLEALSPGSGPRPLPSAS